uniref:Uncharacterized protein n=1 Tax=Amphora coffeiformis TaxID=265554 RepID=A0A7S3L020_9STRA|eukprot:scaffold5298_cov103-Amphora_coffeaeformis.AAC.2
MSEVFTRGVCLYAMARKTGKNKFKRPARAIRKIIKKLVRQRSLNQKHQLCLLNAEDKALSKNKGKASNSYREGIVTAARGGFLRDAALINERYADFLLNDVEDRQQASQQVGFAIRRYEERGAIRTVEELQSKYFDLLKDDIPKDLGFGGGRPSLCLDVLESSGL